jgi:MFS family permease
MQQERTVADTPWWQQLDHRKLPALLLVSMCGLYGPMIANLLPSFVTAWIEQLGVSESVAGDLATVNLLAHASGLTLSLYLVSRYSLPEILRCGLVLAVVGDGASMFAPSVAFLGVARVLTGLGLGLQFGAVINWFGRNDNAARGFALFIMMQFVFAAACFFLIPSLAPIFRSRSVYVVLLPLVVAAALLAPLLKLNGGSRPLAADPLRSASVRAPLGPVLLPRALSVLAFALFNVAAIGLWGYMERYGLAVGLSTQAVAVSLSMSALCGIPGGLVVFGLGRRFGRLAPLVLGLATFALPVGVFALRTVRAPLFFLGLALIGFAWNIAQPYLQDVQSSLDRSGRLPVLGMIVAAMAGAFGPALVGGVVDGQHYQLAFEIAVGILAASAAVAVFPAVLVDRHESDANRTQKSEVLSVAGDALP